MIDIQDLHNEILDLLLELRNTRYSDLRFTLRQTNRSNRLEDGYWFLGNDFYLALSFWKGTDWKSRTPNIFFRIKSDGSSTVEISVSDSEDKETFVTEALVKQLGLSGSENKFKKELNSYDESTYLTSLRQFIENEKIIIDEAINQYQDIIPGAEDTIGYIDKHEFENNLKRILNIRDKDSSKTNEKPIKLISFNIQGFGPIKESLGINNIEINNQWVFITGMNGTGKSSILKALAVSLSRKAVEESEFNSLDFVVKLTLVNNKNYRSEFIRINNKEISNRLKPIVQTLSVYGPLRLNTIYIDKKRLKYSFSKTNYLDSMREKESYLLDVNRFIQLWKSNPKHSKYLKDRLYYISAVLSEMLESSIKVSFDQDKIFYKDKNGVIDLQQLSTGLKGTIGLIGDLMIRMYEQNPSILDPTMFKGIAIIDEIDAHLHPTLQKKLVEELTETFPGIQFIATTHSPIPLLGAPKNTVILLTSSNDQIKIERLDDKIEFKNLLPNSLLSSPIFGFEEFIDEDEQSLIKEGESDRVIVEDSFSKIQFNELLKKDITEFLNNQKQEELIRLFKKQ